MKAASAGYTQGMNYVAGLLLLVARDEQDFPKFENSTNGWRSAGVLFISPSHTFCLLPLSDLDAGDSGEQNTITRN